MIIQAVTTHSDFKKSMQISSKKHLPFLVMPTSTITDAMALKFFADIIYIVIIKLTLWRIFESDQNSQNSDRSLE